MGFVNWWKTSSQAATEAHYALRFDESELDDLRGGRLNESARAKFKARVQSYKKFVSGILIGCGIPLLVIGFPFVLMFGYGIYSAAGALRRSPIAWIWLGFVLLVLSLIVVGYVYVAVKLFVFKRNVAADLKNSHVGIAEGNVDVKSIGAHSNRKTEYRINEVQFSILGDAIGSEFHRHFQNESKTKSERGYRTNEIYRFCYLPQSKLLVHYERL